jgi:hypothetical protein
VKYSGGTGNTFPPITCDGTSHAVTLKLPRPSGATWYEPGPAHISNGNAGEFPSDSSCGQTLFGNPPQEVPLPCDTATFSGGVRIVAVTR